MSSKNKALWTPARHTRMIYMLSFYCWEQNCLSNSFATLSSILSCSRTHRSQSLNLLCLSVKYRQVLRTLFSGNFHLWQVKLPVSENWNSGHNIINRGWVWGQVFIPGTVTCLKQFCCWARTFLLSWLKQWTLSMLHRLFGTLLHAILFLFIYSWCAKNLPGRKRHSPCPKGSLLEALIFACLWTSPVTKGNVLVLMY